MTEEIKKVLDMPDSQQRLWLFTHIGKDTSNDRDLAYLAFRLRDEASKDIEGCERYNEALEGIYKYLKIQKQAKSFYGWITYLRPIDMIIAALMAKGKK